MSKDWYPDNPEGLKNFSIWAETELKKLPKQARRLARVTRKNKEKDFSPENCELVAAVKVCQKRATSVLDADTVIAMRRYRKEFPNSTLEEMEAKFNHSQVNISRAIRGITWSNVNELEAPVGKSSRWK